MFLAEILEDSHSEIFHRILWLTVDCRENIYFNFYKLASDFVIWYIYKKLHAKVFKNDHYPTTKE